MSRFLNGISNRSSLIYKKGSRVFSSSSVSGPFLRFSNRVKHDIGGEDVHLFDASKECDLFIPERTPPKELHNATLAGTTLGWGLYRDAALNTHWPQNSIGRFA